jgi:flagellar biosynthesis/type III secretory pathway protein FliH
LLDADEATACQSAIELLRALQTLHDRRHALMEAAQSRARAEGYAAGRQEAIGLLAPRWLQAWQQAALDSTVKTDALRQAAGLLACQIVQQIASELAPAEVVVALVQKALATRVGFDRCVVRVHPDVAAALSQPVALPALGCAAALTVQADSSLGLMDCVIQSALGECVVGLRSQLDQIAKGLSA